MKYPTTTAPENNDTRWRTPEVALALLILLAALSSFLFIGNRSPDGDELMSIFNVVGKNYNDGHYSLLYQYIHNTAPASWSSECRAISVNEGHPPLYFLLLNLWMRVFGTDLATGRRFSALLGVAAVLAMYITAKHLGGRRLGLTCAGYMAISPFYVFHSQNLKNYSLLILVGTLSIYVFSRTLADRTWRWAILLALVNAVGVYTHYSYLLALVSQVLIVAFLRDRLSILKRLAISWVVPVAALIPWLPYWRVQYEIYGLSVVHEFSPLRPESIQRGIWYVCKFFGGECWFWGSSARARALYLLFAIGASVAVGVFARAACRKRDEKKLVIVGHLCVFLAAWLVSYAFGSYDLTIARRYAVFYPIFCLALVWSGSVIRRRAARVLWILVLLAPLVNTVAYGLLPSRTDWRGASDCIRRNVSDNALIIMVDTPPTILSYYLAGYPSRVSWTPSLKTRAGSICFLSGAYPGEESDKDSVIRAWITPRAHLVRKRAFHRVTVECYTANANSVPAPAARR